MIRAALVTLALLFATPVAAQENFHFFPGAIRDSRNDLIRVDIQPWPNGHVPIQFDPGFTPDQHDRVFRACAQWAATPPYPPVRCTPYAGEAVWLQLTQDGSGCTGYYGANPRGGASPMNMDPSCWGWADGTSDDKPLLHEIGHVLGLLHTHQRLDRDDYISINWEHIEPARRWTFTRMASQHPLVATYDFFSVMHYDVWVWSASGAPTISIQPGHGFIPSLGNTRPTSLDAQALLLIYAPPTQTPTRTSLVLEIVSATNPVTLRWSAGESSYTLHAGTEPGASDLAVFAMGAATSITAIAPSGVPVYVRVVARGASSNEVVVVVP